MDQRAMEKIMNWEEKKNPLDYQQHVTQWPQHGVHQQTGRRSSAFHPKCSLRGERRWNMPKGACEAGLIWSISEEIEACWLPCCCLSLSLSPSSFNSPRPSKLLSVSGWDTVSTAGSPRSLFSQPSLFIMPSAPIKAQIEIQCLWITSFGDWGSHLILCFSWGKSVTLRHVVYVYYNISKVSKNNQEVAVMNWNFLTWIRPLWISFMKGRAKHKTNH